MESAMRNVIRSLIVSGFIFSLTPGASADCSTSLTVSDAGTEFVITATTSSSCQRGTTLWICIDTKDINQCPWLDCGPNCTFVRHIDKACQPAGSHYAYAVSSCGKLDSTGFCNFDTRGSATTEFSFSARPTASLSMTDADAAGNSNVSVTYDLKNLSTIADIDFYVDGGLLSHQRVSGQSSGSYQFSYSLVCLPPGMHSYFAYVTAVCGGWDPSFVAQTNTVTKTATNPTVSVIPNVTASPPTALVIYAFPGTTSSAQREVDLQWSTSSQPFFTAHPADESGTLTVTLPSCQYGTNQQVLLADAKSCGGDSAHDSKGFTLPKCETSCSRDCPDCTGHPIRVTNGNMRLTDSDLLPGAPLAPLQRTYDSQLPNVRAFGKGWTSVFDASLMTQGTSDGRQFATLLIERNDPLVFMRRDGAYRQI